jgi:hypothetical protein
VIIKTIPVVETFGAPYQTEWMDIQENKEFFLRWFVLHYKPDTWRNLLDTLSSNYTYNAFLRGNRKVIKSTLLGKKWIVEITQREIEDRAQRFERKIKKDQKELADTQQEYEKAVRISEKLLTCNILKRPDIKKEVKNEKKMIKLLKPRIF